MDSLVRFVRSELSYCRHPLLGQVSMESEVIAKYSPVDNCLSGCGGDSVNMMSGSVLAAR